MYYPIQIPSVLNPDYKNYLVYKEEVVTSIQDFVICIWESYSHANQVATIEEIIITDGCIDLVVDYENKQIMYAGMSSTVYDYTHQLPAKNFGARLKPGAFHQITGLPASSAMDSGLPLIKEDTSFDLDYFWSLSFDEAKLYFICYLEKRCKCLSADPYTRLFDQLIEHPVETVSDLAALLYVSPRKCQRDARKIFGISPQVILSIIRFQRCLTIILDKKAASIDVLSAINYYDQPHMIRDFKRNIGITPFELLKRY